VHVGTAEAHVVFASSPRIDVVVTTSESGRLPVRIDGVDDQAAVVDVGEAIATGLHQVDNPIVDR
jgi:hypothetical protein